MQDLRDAVRALRAAPLVSAVAILSLALGIGANTAIFSILNSLLLKPLPVREPSQLVVVGAVDQAEWFAFSYPVWKGIQERRIFDQAFAWGTDRVGLSETGELEFAEAIWATGDVFDVLGLPAALGRTFDARDDRRGGGPDGPVAVIAHGFWQRRFGGAPDTIGRTLTIERVPYTIVGVTPPGFFGAQRRRRVRRHPSNRDRTAPRAYRLLDFNPQRGRGCRSWRGARPGQTAESLTAGLRAAQPQIRAATMPDFTHAEDRDAYLRADWIAREAPAGVSRLRRQYGPALLTLLGVVGLVLLVACANIATLMLGRSAARRYEFSVRRALGASRGRLVRQLLAESLLLSAIGAALGFAFARWGSRLLVAQLSTWASTAVLDLSVDWRVLGVTAAATIATALLFGTRACRRGGPRAAHRGVEAATARARRAAPRRRRRLARDRAGRPVARAGGWRGALPAFVRGARVSRSRIRSQPRARGGRGRAAERRAGRRPGRDCTSASARRLRRCPVSRARRRRWRRLSGAPACASRPTSRRPEMRRSAGRNVRILTNPVSPDWFRTFGTRILAGRDFDARDGAGAPGVVIVNEAFARTYFEGATPLGRTLVEVAGPADRRPLEIVGLVEDAAFASVREPVGPTIYKPLAQRLDELSFVPPISVSVRARQGLSPATPDGRRGRGDWRRGPGSRRDVSDGQRAAEPLLYSRASPGAALGILRRARAAVGRARHLRRRGVLRQPPPHGNRNPDGARRGSGSGRADGALARLAAGGRGNRGWFARQLVGGTFCLPRSSSASRRGILSTLVAAALGLAVVAAAAGWLPARRAARIDPAAVLREG